MVPAIEGEEAARTLLGICISSGENGRRALLGVARSGKQTARVSGSPRTDIRQGQTGQRRPELGRSGADSQRRRPGTFAAPFSGKLSPMPGRFLRLGGTAVLRKRHPGLRPAAAGRGTRFDPGYALPARRIHNAAGGPPLRRNGASDRRRAERRHPAAGMVVRRFALSSG